MKYQTRAFQISLLLHSLIFVVVVILSIFIGQSKKLMVLDFNLSKPEPYVKKVETPAPAPVIKTKPIKPQGQTSKEPSRMPEERPKAAPSPETPPMIKLPEAPNLESSPMGLAISDHSKALKEGSPGMTGGSKDGTGSGTGTSDGGKDSAGKKYLKEHFAYIRDKILKNISYPDSARRMGWQGKVVLSFIITPEGSVREFKIIQGSGFPILDKSAIETVKDTAPFPKPPGEAQLVIPIIYRLE